MYLNIDKNNIKHYPNTLQIKVRDITTATMTEIENSDLIVTLIKYNISNHVKPQEKEKGAYSRILRESTSKKDNLSQPRYHRDELSESIQRNMNHFWSFLRKRV
ncbi:hypothetical protein M758_7G044200 [Ceratodon purpureus]|uniref:Uncharacterized protein n=1 Tax=Ceratodon purpureus TaxID=3225 RepID=A0A8T0H766_CERPU|nr:hypothetical protein KC19_7G047400 [Ceratodon purpureus]KAG0610179.1 hypothetical protein M758_7G044200 [Ceratodon purpureus]